MVDVHQVMLAEIAREKAETLGRAGRVLEAALEKLRAFERGDSRDAGQRERLLLEAAEKLANLVVQQEAFGLRDPRSVFEMYGVPREVVNRMGIGSAKPVI